LSIKETLVSRLLDQQRDCPNWNLLIECTADFFQDYIDTVVKLLTETWPGNSSGFWQDRVGEIVGVTRPAEEELENIFTVCEEGETDEDPVHCWGEHDEAGLGGYVYDLFGILLDDEASTETFDMFISAKIAATNADASVPGIAKYLKNGFGLDCTVTSGIGVCSVEITGGTNYDLRTRRFIMQFAPVLAGVDFVLTKWPED
jgi:hypothetical protein